jgi:dipeptidyl aminopeptidase/acylaminoacyl peptidase
VYVISSADANAARLLEISADGEMTVLASDQTYDISGCLLHPLRHHPQAAAILKARQEWIILDPEIQADFDYLNSLHEGELFVLSRDSADRIWVVELVSDDAPARFFLYRRLERELDFLFADFPELSTYSMNRVRPIEIMARDGFQLHGFLTLPSHLAAAALPLVILVHGGPWARDVQRFSPEVQRLSNRGYAVLQVNFRGSTGYGKDYMLAGDRQWGKSMLSDVLDAKDHVTKLGIVDPRRVGIYGFSFGGYTALCAMAFAPSEFRCGIAAMAPTNLISFIEAFPDYWSTQAAMLRKRIGDPAQDRRSLEAASPYFHSEHIAAPLLLCHGANDPRVKRAESDRLVAALQSRGQSVTYLVFADEGHGIHKPKNRLAFFGEVEVFLGRHLGGMVEGSGSAVKAGQDDGAHTQS